MLKKNNSAEISNPYYYCNYTKFENWNKIILDRQFPDHKLTPLFDPRPDFNYGGDIYVIQPRGPITSCQNDTSSIHNLNPLRNDRDCFFCSILNSLEPGKGNYLEFLKRIDIDSYTRGLTQFNTKCPNQKTDPYCLLDGLCPNCTELAENDPTIVKIINRWDDPNMCFQIPATTNVINHPQFYNGYNKIPIEKAFNNRTKALDQAPINY
jgi:hypothetical protein